MKQEVVVAGEESSGGCRRVVVGVKLDGLSRELLTWALVKVAQPGDLVLALHVLDNNGILDRDGKSSLLSLVKAFDSVLAVYEGFCNLKQVDLKLKICRGESVRKILVREAKSYCATDLIVGTARNHHKIRPSTSVAKYCAKSLGKECSVRAVNNGKIVFHKGADSASHITVKGIEHRHRNGFLDAIQRTLSKNSKVLNDGDLVKAMVACDESTYGASDPKLVKKSSESTGSGLKQNCSICTSNSASVEDSAASSTEKESSTDNDGTNSMSIIPVPKLEAACSSFTVLRKESPELKLGWPLLRRAISSNTPSPGSSSMRKISVVQWAMRLPSRPMLIKSSDDSEKGCDHEGEESSELDRDIGAIIPLGVPPTSDPYSPNHTATSLPEELMDLQEKYSATCRLFKYEELLSATSNFMPGNVIGKGGSSQVYRGRLLDGKELAVKILKMSEDAIKEFVLEIEIITTIHHKNVVSLFGFCYDQNQLLLVYDFLSSGSLEENLHGNKKDPLLFGWKERYKVAVGIAEALDYLHNRHDQPVIHRDVKSSNILLSDDFEPQLSDFGLAMWASSISSQTTCTDVAGTFGYLAPEYFMYGKVNDKIDVYSFGVVLLELLSGRKPISTSYPKGQESLVMWAKPILSNGKFTQLLDPRLDSNYDFEQVERMLLTAALCIRRAPRARPKMSVVLKLLRGDAEILEWARLQVNAPEGSQTKLQVSSLEGSDAVDEAAFSHSDLLSHLNLALQGVEDSLSISSSIEQSILVEDYLRGRWSRSSSLD